MSKHITLPDDVAAGLYIYLLLKDVCCYFTIADNSNFTVYYDDTANSTIENMVNEWLSMDEDERMIFDG